MNKQFTVPFTKALDEGKDEKHIEKSADTQAENPLT